MADEELRIGKWVKAQPLPMYGWKAKTEQRLRRWHVPIIPEFLAWWDERGLGK